MTSLTSIDVIADELLGHELADGLDTPVLTSVARQRPGAERGDQPAGHRWRLLCSSDRPCSRSTPSLSPPAMGGSRADVDTGYRRYATEQIVTAQIIRRFRDLEMPLEDIRIVLQAPDVETRNRVIANHLARLESALARTHEAVTSLRELLDHPQAGVPSITDTSPPRPPLSSRTSSTRPTRWPGIAEPSANWPPRFLP